MGSFNTTCFASQQTIATGDKCRVLPIMQQATYKPVGLVLKDGQESEEFGITSSTCYASAFWRPVGAFIAAQYDDYGRVELNFEGLTMGSLIEFFGEVLAKCPSVKQGENEFHDHPFDFAAFVEKSAPSLAPYIGARKPVPGEELAPMKNEELTACWDYIFEVASEHRLFMKDYRGCVRPLQFAIIHEDAYQALIQEVESGTDWEDNSLDRTQVLQRALAKARKDAQEQEEDFKRMAFNDAIRDAINRFGSESSRPSMMVTAFLSLAIKKLMAGELEDNVFIQKFLPHLDDRYALSGLEYFNLKITPLVYASQDYSNEIGASYAKFVSAVSKKVSRGRKVKYHGDYYDYNVLMSGKSQLDAFTKICQDSDAPIDAVEVTPRKVGEELIWEVEFASPLQTAELLDLIAEMKDSDNMKQSLLRRFN